MANGGSVKSKFTGSPWKMFFMRLGLGLLSVIPFVGLPNAICIMQRYIARHTRIVGMKLVFNGTAGKCLGQIIKWGFFTVITLGIYGAVYAPVRYQQWVTENTVFAPVDVDPNQYPAYGAGYGQPPLPGQMPGGMGMLPPGRY